MSNESIIFTCQQCDAQIETEEQYIGGYVECPACNNIVMIPTPGIYPGMQLDVFETVKQLGFGGIGEVWLANQPTMKRQVILKILSPALTADKELVKLFTSEVKKIAKLNHPNIVMALKAGSTQGFHFLATAYIEGMELEQKMAGKKPLPEKKALLMIRKLAEALAYAWDNSRLIHRNIKPSNIMIEAKTGEPMLMDMGLSKSIAEDTSITKTGIVIGSPAYMSPEVACAEDNVDFHADMFSLGATLYFLLTGRAPYEGKNANKIFMEQFKGNFPLPKTVNPDVSKECNKLVSIMTAKDPENRHNSWESLLKDIDTVLSGKPLKKTGKSSQKKKRTTGKQKLSPQEALKRRRADKPAPKAKLTKEIPGKSKLFTPKTITIAVVIFIILLGSLIVTHQVMEHKRELAAKRAAEEEKREKERKLQEIQAKKDKRKEEIENITIWKTAIAYANKYVNKDNNYEAAIEKLTEARDKLIDTKYANMANRAILKIEESRKKKIEKIMEDLAKRAESYAKRNAFQAAANLYKNYKGILEKETAVQRKKLEDEYTVKAKGEAEKRRKARIVHNQNRAILIKGLASMIIDGDFRSAQGKFNGSIQKKSYPEITKIFDNLLNVENTILENLSKRTGKKINIIINSRKKTLPLKEIKGRKIYVTEKVGKASFVKKASLKDLPISEQLKCTGKLDKTAVNIFIGVELYRKGNVPAAKQYFQKCGIFSKALLEKIK